MEHRDFRGARMRARCAHCSSRGVRYVARHADVLEGAGEPQLEAGARLGAHVSGTSISEGPMEQDQRHQAFGQVWVASSREVLLRVRAERRARNPRRWGPRTQSHLAVPRGGPQLGRCRTTILGVIHRPDLGLTWLCPRGAA